MEQHTVWSSHQQSAFTLIRTQYSSHHSSGNLRVHKKRAQKSGSLAVVHNGNRKLPLGRMVFDVHRITT